MSSTTAEQVLARAVECGVRVATAESLTGGLLAASLVRVPGASRCFVGGVVAYDTELKAQMLGVDRGLLERVGPVDAEVCRQMAAGARRICGNAEFGVATTGVAGPAADPQTGQPAGTVWVAVSSALGERALLVGDAAGDRDEIRAATTEAALRLLLEELYRA